MENKLISTLEKLINKIEWITDIYILWDDKVSIRAFGELGYNFRKEDKGESLLTISNTILKEYLIYNLWRFDLQYRFFESEKNFNFRTSIGDNNFRVNASLSEWKLLLIFRLIKSDILNLKELWIDLHYLKWILNINQWLFLISWPTGSWKSTTLSSIINHYNTSYNKHIITLEDPIEQTYKDDESIIHQLELWDDFLSFESWMKNILRQDPDIIIIWEIRNKETLDIALKLSETWHLVIWTIHWKGANWIIGKIIRMYNNEKQIAWMLADILVWILYQQKFILENKETIICIETLYNTEEIQAWFKQWKYNDFKSNMQTSYNEYMVTMEQYLENYLNKKYKLSGNDYKKIQTKISWL